MEDKNKVAVYRGLKRLHMINEVDPETFSENVFDSEMIIPKYFTGQSFQKDETQQELDNLVLGQRNLK